MVAYKYVMFSLNQTNFSWVPFGCSRLLGTKDIDLEAGLTDWKAEGGRVTRHYLTQHFSTDIQRLQPYELN